MEETQNVRISVRNLVEFILREGDIDNRRGSFSEKEAMQEGSRIHRKIQKEMGSGYRAEVPLSIDVSWDSDSPACPEQAAEHADAESRAEQEPRKGPALILTVEGRADGIFTEKDAQPELTYIDEIKGIYRNVMTLECPFSVHLAQAKCYAYIYGTQHQLSLVGVQMTYCNLESAESQPLQIHRFRQVYEMPQLKDWFMNVAGRYRKWAQLETDWRRTRQASIRGLEFPYAWRPGQKEVASSVYRTIIRRKKLFIQAPTGTGKTLSTVFPAVKAVGEGKADRIFYATAKTITRTVAEEAFSVLREHGLHMKTVTLTAKEKICFMEETECNPDACPYAKGHYDRVNDAVYELITSCESMNRKTLEEQAEKWHVCPFEMGLDAALWTDAVICDYNYIFDPRARLKRFFGEGAKGDYLFLIDEAHNLVDRGREMFSASLYKEEFLALKKEFQNFAAEETAERRMPSTGGIIPDGGNEAEGRDHGPSISRRRQPGELLRLARAAARALGRCNKWFLDKKRESSAEIAEEPVRILKAGTENGGLDTLPVLLMNLCGLIEDFLEDSLCAELNTKTLELYFQVRRFLDTCDRLNENYVIYTENTASGQFLLRLYCVDISENLQECLDKGKSTIYFSATLLPIQYYKSLLSSEKDNYAIYAQPVFDPAKRLVLIGTDTSSRYKNRSPREYRRMAEYIFQVMQARRGNYMAFFSSYQMMDDVADCFDAVCAEAGEPIETVRQMHRMSEQEREDFLRKFEQPHPQGLAGFCVMGGIFGEGIDLREDRLIGAIIVGAGLPQVCTEREILKRFYDERGEDGFFYAYLCPGMNRVLQSAGRVIRTESDRGVILLLDERFAAARYRSMFPKEWERPGLCTLGNVGEKTAEFWDKS
ncbi:MAG: ATP-dependent DNA helicase [Clostridiales bacterium]|nr:ATP-dependent DNA helicase [Clostridiales bacterium]